MRFKHLLAVGFLLLPSFAFAQATAQDTALPARPPGLQPPEQRQNSPLAVPP